MATASESTHGAQDSKASETRAAHTMTTQQMAQITTLLRGHGHSPFLPDNPGKWIQFTSRSRFPELQQTVELWRHVVYRPGDDVAVSILDTNGVASLISGRVVSSESPATTDIDMDTKTKPGRTPRKVTVVLNVSSTSPRSDWECLIKSIPKSILEQPVIQVLDHQLCFSIYINKGCNSRWHDGWNESLLCEAATRHFVHDENRRMALINQEYAEAVVKSSALRLEEAKKESLAAVAQLQLATDALAKSYADYFSEREGGPAETQSIAGSKRKAESAAEEAIPKDTIRPLNTVVATDNNSVSTTTDVSPVVTDTKRAKH